MVFQCDKEYIGAAACYEKGSIIFYKPAYNLFKTMEKAEANGDSYAAEKTGYHIDQLISHELAHALTFKISFDAMPFLEFSYSRPRDRRLAEGLAELIGFYVTQKVNGKPFDNGAIADAMLEAVKQRQESINERNRLLATSLGSLEGNELADAQRNIRWATQCFSYDYAKLGFAQALKANKGMNMPKFLRRTLRKPEKLAGISTHILDLDGATAELDKIYDSRFMSSKYEAPVALEELRKELELQSKLSSLMSKGAAMRLAK